MIIHANEFIPAGFSVISNRTFLLYNFKAILCEKSHQFAEFQELFLCIGIGERSILFKIQFIGTRVNNPIRIYHEYRTIFFGLSDLGQ